MQVQHNNNRKKSIYKLFVKVSKYKTYKAANHVIIIIYLFRIFIEYQHIKILRFAYLYLSA